MSNIQIALMMTVVGMGIVFIGILILWGVMALMVRIWPHDGGDSEAEEVRGSPEDDGDLRARAAAAAVAVVMTLHREVFSASASAPAGGASSSWQVTTRAMQVNQNTQSFNRKPRGDGR
jgi:Na+-transporting methylmalonyl-CoA/oxaloacetate decarboxylase gamma subunit